MAETEKQEKKKPKAPDTPKGKYPARKQIRAMWKMTTEKKRSLRQYARDQMAKGNPVAKQWLQNKGLTKKA